MTKDGLYIQCKHRRRQYFIESLIKIKKYYLDNRDQKLMNQKGYYSRNYDKIISRKKTYSNNRYKKGY